MSQTLALAIDAYRELNSRKLFWFTIALSTLVVVVMGMFGVNDKGITFLWYTIDNEIINSRLVSPRLFYSWVYASIGVPVWLAWVATILALISTASIIPDFIAGGAIELVLSKPISRARLYLTKVALGAFFVAVQVGVFSLACFLLIGIRGGSWRPSVFLAIPIIVVFFLYLYSLCALLGLLTRSTIAALLLTLLFWVALWGVNVTDGVFTVQHQTAIKNVGVMERRVALREKAARERLDKARADGTPITTHPLPPGAADELEAANPLLAKARAELVDARAAKARWDRWTRLAYLVKTPLPKTGETIGLLNRWLIKPGDRDLFRPPGAPESDPDAEPDRVRFGDPGASAEAEEAILRRPTWWVVGTSAGFTLVMLALGTWIFARRDF